MKKHIILFSMLSLSFLFSCEQQKDEKEDSAEQTVNPQNTTDLKTNNNLSKYANSQGSAKVVYINSLDELYALFKEHRYTREDWELGHKQVPRIVFTKVNEQWQHSSSSMPVKVKKEVFFRLMAPLVLMANEEIMQLRQSVIDNTLSDEQLRQLMVQYRVIKQATNEAITEQHKSALLARLDIIPPSLALAQAAEESGWATSRFTLEGNAFFGQWDYSGQGMVPKSQRKELGNYGIARFDTPLDSVKGYALNINRGHAYEKLRALRAKLREQEQPITGLQLAQTLDKYSERGQAYIDSISSMIRYNKLMFVDEALLSDGQTIIIKSGNE